MKTYLRFFRYFRPHWRGLVVVLVTMFLHIGLGVLHPWPVKLLVDQVLGDEPVPEELEGFLAALPGPGGLEGLLLWVCVSTVLIYLVGTFMSAVSNVVSVRLGQRMTFDLAADLFRHVQRLSLLFHSRQPVGDTMSRVTGDSYCVQEMIVDVAFPLLEAVVTLVAMFVIMWQIEPTMTLLSLGVVPFLVVAILAFRKPMYEWNLKRRELEGLMMALVEQVLSAIPAVQAFNREELEEARLRRCGAEAANAYVRSATISAWFGLIAGLVTTAGTAGIMWLGGLYALEGKITTGDILVFLAYLSSLYGPLDTLTHLASTWQHVAANAERVTEILDTPVDVYDRPDAREVPIAGLIRYEDVTFGYEPDRAVLKGVSLEVRPGEVVAIVGPTGAGKTTLVNLMVRFFDPWSGRVTVDGEDIRSYRLRCLREQVALVLQEPFLFPFTVAENIAYGRPDATRAEVEAAAAAASADDFIRRLPGGYDEEVGERGATLSGGEKQRLSIARAFLKNAPVLILDEPTSALDARTEAQLLDALNRLMKGRTTFIIAHRLSTIRNADRILVINHGELVDQGRHEELMARGGLYAGLYRQQMEIARHEPVPEMAAVSERNGEDLNDG